MTVKYNGHNTLFISCPSQDSSVGSIQLGTGEVPGSNTGKGENFSMKISN